MRIKPIHIIVALLFIGLLSFAVHLENKAYDRCMESLTHNECVKIFG